MNLLIVAATRSEVTSEIISSLPLLITGVGMINTAINLTNELKDKNYGLVINMWVAGTFSPQIKLGNVVEVTEDFFSEIGYENGEEFSEF